MKKLLLLNILLISYGLKSQRLLTLQQTATGSVVPIIQATPVLNPYKPVFSNDYAGTTAANCHDSLLIQTNKPKTVDGNLTVDWESRVCAYQFDFTSFHLYNTSYWVNDCDPAADADLDLSSGTWDWNSDGKSTWYYSVDQKRYVCGNDRHGHTYSNHQTWQLDEKKRLKKITRTNDEDKVRTSLEYFYTASGQLKRISKTNFQYTEKVEAERYQTEWFYDSKQRNWMMIAYDGAYRMFTPQKLESFKKQLEASIKSGKNEWVKDFDAEYIRQLVVYNYGSFGLVQANCYRNEAERYDDHNFLSDSLFYDKNGKVSRCVIADRSYAYKEELIYAYDTLSGRLKQAIAHHYSDQAYQEWTDQKVTQQFTYGSNNKINSSTEKHYYIKREYRDGKFSEPNEEYREEIYTTYGYKP